MTHVRPGAARTALLAVFAALLAAGLALLVAGCSETLSSPGIGSSAQTTDALALLPADADVYGMTNLAAARASDAMEAALGDTGLGMMSGTASPDFEEFVRLTGFDPAEDLDRVYMAAAEGDRERAAFVAYGRFDRARIEQFVASREDAEFEVSDVDGIPLYLATGDDGDRGGFALASDQMVMAGDESTLRGMLRRLGTSGQTPDAELQALFDRVAYPDGAWFVARGFDGMAPGDDAPPSAMAARAANGVVVSMSFDGDGVPVRAFLATKPEASTADVADVIRGSLSAARIGMKDQPAALDVLDRVEVDAEETGVRMEAFLTRAFLADARGMHGPMHD